MAQLKTLLNSLLAGIAATVVMVASAQAALVARDLDGDTVTDAFYDTDLNITWLRDANVNGSMTWDAANTWASGYSFGGYDDWRLPTALNADGTGPCSGFNCTASEMGHLWYTELGNTGSFANVGDFLNAGAGYYWSGTSGWGFNYNNGRQFFFGTAPEQFTAMAVRTGDVVTSQVVPEPESLLLALTALSALALARRRRAVGASAP